MGTYQGKPIIRSHNDLTDIGSKSHTQIDSELLINIPSTPPAGYKKIINIYWDPNVGEIIVEVEP